MTMHPPLKPTDYDLEAQPIVCATRTADADSGSEHSWVPNVAYTVAGAALFFDSWDTTQKRKWCLSHEGDTFTDKEQDEYDRQCAFMIF
jgi:hypothetical protein